MAATPDALRPTPAWRAKAARFWTWWTSELRAMVPERFEALAGSGRVPVVAFENDRLVIASPLPPGGAPEAIALGSMDPAIAATAAGDLVKRAGEARGRVRLGLGPTEALVRRVTLPAATEEDLASVLGFEMDRLTPFRAAEVYFDHRIVGRDAAAGTITALLAVARRDFVDARLETLRNLGLSVQGATLLEESQHPGAPLDLLPSTQRGEREKPSETLVRRGLIAAACLLLFASLAIPIVRKRSDLLALVPQEQKAHAEARATDALIRELERQAADYNFLLARKHANAPALAYLEEVARLLPDNTWLQHFEMKTPGKTREISMSGETASSSKLIEILEQSTLMQNAAQRGAVTRGSAAGTERFVISAEPKPRPQPEAKPLVEAQAPPPIPPMSPRPPGT